MLQHLIVVALLFLLTLCLLHLKKLNLNRLLISSIARMSIQLLLIGLVLRYIFSEQNHYITFLVLSVITVSGSYIAFERQINSYKGRFHHIIISFGATAWITAMTVSFLIKGSDYFFTPPAIIPLFGIICGNMLNGFVIGLRELSDITNSQRSTIETKLSLGATRSEAIQELVSSSIEKALLPITNAMLSAGIVSLPGVLVGQLTAGEDPLKGVVFQMVVLASILFSTSFG